jgi:folate-binding protein YgfZ
LQRVYKLPDTVLSIKGNAAGFLNGIASNTLDAPLNAFLNQHGRIIATFRQQRISDDEFAISVPAIAKDNLLRHLERYMKLSHVSITPGDQSVFINVDTNQTVWTQEPYANSISDEEFTLYRLNHSIPLMGVDYQADEFILNVHEHDYVSYTKGCFLGQEPVAKVHNRAKPSRKLIVVFEDHYSPEEVAKMTSRIKDPATGRTKGFKFISSSLPPTK